MNLQELKLALNRNPNGNLRFRFDDADTIPAHAHVTEVGTVDKIFMDCGGEIHRNMACMIQVWVADDTEHRLTVSHFIGILEKSAPLLPNDFLPIEIEYEDCILSQFRLERVENDTEWCQLILSQKHTDCLAKEVCLPTCCDQKSGKGCC